jgi:hypothetical protein
MNSDILSQFQSFIHQHFLDALEISPINSTTPFEIGNALTGQKEFLFISNLTPFLYAPVKGRDIHEKVNLQFSMYNEGEDLILRFEMFDMILESEIRSYQAKEFLSVLLHQEKINLAIVDTNTYELIWIHTIPFRTIRFHYKEIFELYQVI